MRFSVWFHCQILSVVLAPFFFSYFACKLQLISFFSFEGADFRQNKHNSGATAKKKQRNKSGNTADKHPKKNKSGTTAKFQVVTQYKSKLPQSQNKSYKIYKSFGQEENRIFQRNFCLKNDRRIKKTLKHNNNFSIFIF
jgi:hypothetical protein